MAAVSKEIAEIIKRLQENDPALSCFNMFNHLLPEELGRGRHYSSREEFAALVEALVNYKSLVSLKIYNTNIFPLGVEVLSKILLSQPMLKRLSLPFNTPFYDDRSINLEQLALALANTNQLIKLDLKKNKLRPESIIHLAPVFKKNMKLSKLNLSYNELGTEGASSLAKIIADHCAITHLNLRHCILGNSVVESLAEVFTNNKISCLDLSSNQLGEAGAARLSYVLMNYRRISKLDLSFNNFGCIGIRNLNSVFMNNNITHLTLAENQIGEQGMFHLAAVLSNSSIEYLDLNRNLISSSAAINYLIAIVRSNEKLKELELGSNQIGGASMNLLTDALVEHKSLTFVCLRRLGISQDNLYHLVNSLDRSNTITGIDLSSNRFNSESIDYLLAFIAKNQSIKYLDMSGCWRNTIININSLTNIIENNNNLLSLNIGFNTFSFSDLKRLIKSMKKNRVLQELYLGPALIELQPGDNISSDNEAMNRLGELIIQILEKNESLLDIYITYNYTTLMSDDKSEIVYKLLDRNKAIFKAKIKGESELKKNCMTFSLLDKKTKPETSTLTTLPREMRAKILMHTGSKFHTELERRKIIFRTLANPFPGLVADKAVDGIPASAVVTSLRPAG